MRRTGILTAMAALSTVVLAACGGTTAPSRPPAADTDRAQAIADNMLTAYNTGDYQALSRDWAGPVRLVVSERAFQRFRDKNLPVTGRFTRLISVTPRLGQQDADHASYQVRAQFERLDSVLFIMTLSADNTRVEGVEFHPQS